MVVQTQQIKRDEQHPLLKVDTGGPGGGDSGLPQQPPSTIMTPGWNVACSPKRSWLSRWPEFISACWMTLILLGITFLVFYALGMNAYRRQSLIIVKCNTTKPENNVYFHHIIPRGSYLPFTLYSDYLSSLAMEYPFLHINVHFLFDDSSHDSHYPSKHLKLLKRFGQSVINEEYECMNDRDKQELKMFQQRYGNLNITIMPLSRYISLTPLRCKWKMIPSYYLPFYARIFAVWEYGGIGLDLTTLNNQFNNNQMPDHRITAILRQHNDGIEDKKYKQTLNSINKDEQTEFLNVFYNLMTNIFSKSDSFFDIPLIDYPVTTKPVHNIPSLSRNYRNKRDVTEITVTETTEMKGKGNIPQNTNNTLTPNSKDNEIIINSTLDTIKEIKNNSLFLSKENTTRVRDIKISENQLNITKTDADIPHVVLFYDFSLFPEGIVGPSYSLPESQHRNTKPLKKINKSPYLLSITSDGTFVAATSRHHPFLGHLLSSASSRINPRFAIENALAFQCPRLLRDDEYCENIYILK